MKTFTLIATALATIASVHSEPPMGKGGGQGGAEYAQIISSKSQSFGPLGECTLIEFDASSGQVLSGFELLSPTEILVPSDGAYFIIAAPQVGSQGGSFDADFWLKINGFNANNSNVRLAGTKDTQDVIVTQGIYVLNEGDVISFCGSGPDAQIQFIDEADEPNIPSIIVSLFKA